MLRGLNKRTLSIRGQQISSAFSNPITKDNRAPETIQQRITLLINHPYVGIYSLNMFCFYKYYFTNMFLLSANHVPALVIFTFSFLWFHLPWQMQGPPPFSDPPASTQASPCLWHLPRPVMLTILLGCAWPVLLSYLISGISCPFSHVGNYKLYIMMNIFWNPEERSRRVVRTSFWNCGPVETRESVTQWAGYITRWRNQG